LNVEKHTLGIRTSLDDWIYQSRMLQRSRDFADSLRLKRSRAGFASFARYSSPLQGSFLIEGTGVCPKVF
jgi:hypothetical protein